jgi:prevent-host-death family protein
MTDTVTVEEARANLELLVLKASRTRERTAITNHGETAAVLINPEELADLEDALAVEQYLRRKAAGEELPTVPHAQALAELGLDRA